MSHRSLAATTLLLLLLSATAVSAQPAGARPARVDIRVESVIISAAKADGRNWDCCGEVARETLTTTANALAIASPPAAAAAYLAALTGRGLSPPDPQGFVELYLDNRLGAEPIVLPRQEDRFNPVLSAGWTNVPFTGDVRLRITIEDGDMTEHDRMTPVLIGKDQLLAALQSGGVYQLNVSSQTNGVGLVFVAVSVVPSG